MELGKAGIAVEVADDFTSQAQRYEEQGYRAAWIAGGQLKSLSLVGDLILGTRAMTVATGIIPTGVFPADQVAAAYADLEAVAPGRFLVGLGGAQQPRSLQALHDYLDRLDRAATPVPRERRYLAALGPRKLALARERFAGAITLLVTPEFTAQSRQALGEAQQIVDLLVVGDTDPTRARAAVRETLGFLTQVPGYRSHLTRLGFAEAELDRVDDRLVDTVVPWGDAETVAAEVRRHWDAGADQVVISPTGAGAAEFAAELSDVLGLA
ncbi:TIGR03620 family F420-dependent LLM class oxidoreductase [Microlunatus parietis]|uniref:Putative F420-dependent oxidoreductase n=1 Tax=Microlunatus parietis TaxID=682979 RepID=A0A7Y9I7K8_9ACTN|nr:TIGR03620 family F420-dependent LLM class oxidoreductase [Microlunatus parietis]NYE71754.1 putative F420-dependent oxidoreductase [Microlunatus parietis]